VQFGLANYSTWLPLFRGALPVMAKDREREAVALAGAY
jgi:hypothetical protein